MRNTLFPISLIVIGVGWFANELQIFPQANWILILALIAAGCMILVFEGINRATIVKAPLLIAIGGALFLHQQFTVVWRILIPCLLILCGVLMLIARSGRLADPADNTNKKPRSPITIDQDPHL